MWRKIKMIIEEYIRICIPIFLGLMYNILCKKIKE